nr:hypothetical protein Iba_chr11aCG11300 [Ipomoea batatas]
MAGVFPFGKSLGYGFPRRSELSSETEIGCQELGRWGEWVEWIIVMLFGSLGKLWKDTLAREVKRVVSFGCGGGEVELGDLEEETKECEALGRLENVEDSADDGAGQEDKGFKFDQDIPEIA